MKKHILLIILSSVIIKIIYVLFAYLYAPETINEKDGMLGVFLRNDSGWYENIATNGYEKISKIEDLGDTSGEVWKQSSWAFFPAYPMTVAFLMHLFSLSFLQSAFIISLILSTACFLAFYIFTSDYLKSRNRAFALALLFIVSPFHYHYSMYYTEAMFLFCILTALAGIQRRQLWLSVLACSLLVLVRPNGIICLLPIWLYQLEQTSFSWKRDAFAGLVKKSLFLVPSVLSFGAYLLYQHLETGYFNAFSIAQKGWGKTTMFPFNAFFRSGNIIDQVNSVYVILVMIFSIYSFKKLPWSFNVFIWINLLLPLTAGSVTSMTRYITALFPLFILIGEAGLKFPKDRYFLYAGCLALQLFWFTFWLVSDGLSY